MFLVTALHFLIFVILSMTKRVLSHGNCSMMPTMPVDEVNQNTRWHQVTNYVLEHHLSFLRKEDLEVHKHLLQSIEFHNVSGHILEFGVAKGGSAMTFAVLKRADRCLHLFDTFQGIFKSLLLKNIEISQIYF